MNANNTTHPIELDMSPEGQLTLCLLLSRLNKKIGGGMREFQTLYQLYLLTIARGYFCWYYDESYFDDAADQDWFNLKTHGLSKEDFLAGVEFLKKKKALVIYQYSKHSQVQQDLIAINFPMLAKIGENEHLTHCHVAKKQQQRTYEAWVSRIDEPELPNEAIKKHFSAYGLLAIDGGIANQ